MQGQLHRTHSQHGDLALAQTGSMTASWLGHAEARRSTIQAIMMKTPDSFAVAEYCVFLVNSRRQSGNQTASTRTQSCFNSSHVDSIYKNNTMEAPHRRWVQHVRFEDEARIV
jgi:hypothetical protein